MARIYLKYAIKNKVYRIDGKHLSGNKYLKPHDVIVVGVNKRRKTCKIKTITSLESEIVDRSGNKVWAFINKKLPDVRSGRITVVPVNELGTHHLSGVNNIVHTVKMKDLYLSTTGSKFPRRYRNIIK